MKQAEKTTAKGASKTTLKRRVSSLLMVLSLVSLFMSGLITLAGVFYLRINTESVKREIGYKAAIDSQQALENLAVEKLSILIQNRVALCDSVLTIIQDKVSMIAYKATDILRHPEKYVANSPLPPELENDGIYATQLLLPENAEMSDFRAEADLIGNIQDLLLNIVESSSYVTTGYIGTESGMFIITDTSSGARVDKNFEPRNRPWYVQAKSLTSPPSQTEFGTTQTEFGTTQTAIWTDIYTVAFDRGEAITCAIPFYDTNGNIGGVAGINLYLDAIKDLVRNTKTGETGFAFILNDFGDIIISENGDEIIIQGLINKRPEFYELYTEIIEGKSGIHRISLDDREFFVGHAILGVLPWHLVTVIDIQEIIYPALQLKEYIIYQTENSMRRFDIIMLVLVSLFIFLFLTVLLVSRYVSQSFAHTITEPILALKDATAQIAEGKFDVAFEIKTSDEIEILGDSIKKMTIDLKEHIQKELTLMVENERISTELNVANQIQSSMLPCLFPAFPDREEIDIFAMMQPAKEVGGDFYDFFFIDENKLALVIADVSGKGVPSALVMVIAKTLIKSKAQAGFSPKEVFESVNNILCENNESAMFVTAFLGYLDLRTGAMSYVNAGHNPPVVLPPPNPVVPELASGLMGGQIESTEASSGTTMGGQSMDNSDFLKTESGFVLGGFKDTTYKQLDTILEPNNILFLYTDGITEAENSKYELFEEDRMLTSLKNNANKSAKELSDTLYNDLYAFVDGAEQVDDITMLVLKYRGIWK